MQSTEEGKMGEHELNNNADQGQEGRVHESVPNDIANMTNRTKTEGILIPAQEHTSTRMVEATGVSYNKGRRTPALFQGSPSLVMASTSSLTPSVATECSCGGGGSVTLVFAIGKLGTDFGTQARRDTFVQFMPQDRNNPDVPDQLLAYLNDKPYEAKSLIWTLNIDANPVYAILPSGPFADLVFERLREFLSDQVRGWSQIISVPGYVSGSIVLYSGQTVPVIIPEIRGLFNWSIEALVEKALGPRPQPPPEGLTPEERSESEERTADWDRRAGIVTDFVNRVYYDNRNLGLLGPDRAMNYTATNVFQLLTAIDWAKTRGRQEFRSFDIRSSPICRPDSECYDVKARFFNPDAVQQADFVAFFTTDVSDVMPVQIGTARQWFEG